MTPGILDLQFLFNSTNHIVALAPDNTCYFKFKERWFQVCSSNDHAVTDISHDLALVKEVENLPIKRLSDGFGEMAHENIVALLVLGSRDYDGSSGLDEETLENFREHTYHQLSCHYCEQVDSGS